MTHDLGLLCLYAGLPWGIVVYYFGLLGNKDNDIHDSNLFYQ